MINLDADVKKTTARHQCEKGLTLDDASRAEPLKRRPQSHKSPACWYDTHKGTEAEKK